MAALRMRLQNRDLTHSLTYDVLTAAQTVALSCLHLFRQCFTNAHHGATVYAQLKTYILCVASTNSRAGSSCNV